MYKQSTYVKDQGKITLVIGTIVAGKTTMFEIKSIFIHIYLQLLIYPQKKDDCSQDLQ